MNLASRIALFLALLGGSADASTILQNPGGKVVAPQVIHQEEAVIGPCKHRGYLEVVVSLKVNVQGVPTEVAVSKSSGYKCVDEASLAAVRGFRFRPATQDGRPVEESTTVALSFTAPDEKRGRD